MAYPIRLSDEVQSALDEGYPIVALESTVIAHGLPWPHNYELARELEAIVTANGATPATIATIDGALCAGLGKAEIERLANKRETVRKLSRRDLPIALVEGGLGATTVAATMLIAHWAGIRVFATGGIGGVHRGDSGDVSADLPELAQTPVAVICAGAKSILDLPRTLEWLETNSVPVIGYETDEFPAFYSRSSGLRVQYRADTPTAVAQILHARDALRLRGGELIAVPIPESDSVDPLLMNGHIEKALALASEQGVSGKELTPFLLTQLVSLTEGVSLQANLVLLRNNAAIAAQIAAELVRVTANFV